MDSRIAILGANGTGKSTLLNLITGVLQPCEGTISKHINLKLAKYSQHSADQLPYDLSPIEYFQKLYGEKYPEKDLQVRSTVVAHFCNSCPCAAFVYRHGGNKSVDSVSLETIKSILSSSFQMVSGIVLSSPSYPWNIHIFSCSVCETLDAKHGLI